MNFSHLNVTFDNRWVVGLVPFKVKWKTWLLSTEEENKTQKKKLSWKIEPEAELVSFNYTWQQHKVTIFLFLCFIHEWTQSMFLSDVQWKNILFSFSLLHVSNLQPNPESEKGRWARRTKTAPCGMWYFFPFEFWIYLIPKNNLCVGSESIDGSISHFEMQLA